MIYDAVRVIARGLQELNRNTDIRVKPLDCNGNETWIHGNSLLNYMKMVPRLDNQFMDVNYSPLILRWNWKE